MKRGLFIIYKDLDKTGGVSKKIKNQINAMNSDMLAVDTLLMKSRVMFGYKLVYRLPFSNIAPCWEYDEKIKEYDFIYLRRPFFMNSAFLRFLKQIKIHNPRVKIVMEIPTYPYDKEITKKKVDYFLLIKDVVSRKQIKKYIDRITVVGNEDTIYGIKTIKIRNGYDVQGTRKRIQRTSSKSINIVAVAMFDYWHGYDRLIQGLGEYYSRGGLQDITLFLVGDGPERKSYEKMVRDMELKNHVQFTGMLEKQEIMSIYDKCDFGACSLGAYRKDLFYSCELKSREYMAVGMPIITGVPLDVMNDDSISKYILEFANDNSPIDINRIVEFYEELYVRNESVVAMIQEIRDHAEALFDMKKALASLMEYLKEK